jgi:hypothetical protein
LQVTNDEAGLRNCWFPGVVQQVTETHALVAYDELDDEDGSQLQEWFQLPGLEQEDFSVTTSFTVHKSPAFAMRPRPPQNVRPRMALTAAPDCGVFMHMRAVCTFSAPLISASGPAVLFCMVL